MEPFDESKSYICPEHPDVMTYLGRRPIYGTDCGCPASSLTLKEQEK